MTDTERITRLERLLKTLLEAQLAMQKELKQLTAAVKIVVDRAAGEAGPRPPASELN